MSTVRHPIDPFQLVVSWDTLEGLVAGMQHAFLADVLGEVKFGAWDGGERLFHYLPKVVADEFGALYAYSLFVRQLDWLASMKYTHI